MDKGHEIIDREKVEDGETVRGIVDDESIWVELLNTLFSDQATFSRNILM